MALVYCMIDDIKISGDNDIYIESIVLYNLYITYIIFGKTI